MVVHIQTIIKKIPGYLPGATAVCTQLLCVCTHSYIILNLVRLYTAVPRYTLPVILINLEYCVYTLYGYHCIDCTMVFLKYL